MDDRSLMNLKSSDRLKQEVKTDYKSLILLDFHVR